MAVSAGDAFLDLHPRLASDFGRQMSSQVQRPVSRAGEEASRHFGRSFAHGIGTAGKAIGIGIAAGMGLAVAAAVKLTPVLRESVQGYRDHLKVVAQTTAAIKSTGGAANASVGQVSRLADALERKTTVDGDVIQTGANMLLTFTNIRNEVGKGNDIFNQATATVTDMSVALGQDTKNSAIQLGKALNDPIRGVTALQRVGVTFTASQRDQIKALVESGHRLDAQKMILRELNREFGGSAEAQATASGRMVVAWHQLQDTIGSILLPVVDRFENTLGRKLIPDLNTLATRYGPGLRRMLLGWVDGFNRTLPSTRELSLGLRALGEAFSGEGITTSSDKFVGKMERVGVAARKVVDWFKQLRPQFSSLGQSASQIGPALASAGGGGHVFANALAVVAPVLDVVARNIHNVLPWLPAMVAGFLAFRAVRTAIAPIRDIGQAIANFTSPATAVATFLNARAQKALAAAMREQAAAAIESAAANRAAAVSVAASGTSAEVAAAQWGASGVAAGTAASRWQLLASALGIFGAALVVGDVVDRVTDKLGRFKGVTEVAAGPVGLLGIQVGGLKDAWAAMTGSQDRAAGSTRVAMDAAQRHTAALRGERDAVNALKSALDGEETAELDVRQAKLNVSSAQQRLTDLVKGGKKGSLEYKQAQLDLKRAQLDLKARTDEYKTAQQKAAAATSGAMHAAQQAQGPYKAFGHKALGAGQQAYTMGVKALQGLRLIPHHYSVNISTTFGFHTPPETSLHQIVGATGGYVTPRAIVPRQLHRGGFLQGPGTETSDSIPARLSKGEYVVNARAVRAVGRGFMDDVNAQGFAVGGPVLDASFPSGSIMGRVATRFASVIGRAMDRLAGKWDRYAKQNFELGGKAAVMRFIRSTDPLPYIWGGAGPGGYDCSGLVGAVQLAHLGRAYGHGQRLYTTSSIHAGAAGLRSGLGGVLEIGVTPGRGHMAGRYGGLGFEAESTRTGIKIGGAASRPESFARHYHLARGGPIEEQFLAALAATGRFDIGGDRGKLRINGQTFDAGGWLMPGTTVARNNTGRPERILAPGEGAVNLHVELNFSGPVIGDTATFAREVTPQIRRHLKDQLRREGKIALASQL